MKIAEHGTRGDHWGTKGSYDMVIHHHGGQIQLKNKEDAYDLCYMLLEYLNDE